MQASKIVLVGLFICFCILKAQSQNQEGTTNEGQLHGNFQTDFQYYNKDTLIGAPDVPEKFLMNSYANFVFTKGKFTAGARYEGYLNTLQGFPNQGGKNNGIGIPHRYASYKADELEVTVGTYYEQFGNGLIFRTYEDKNLGYDNALDGIRVLYNPVKGLNLKGVAGLQRVYFSKGPGIVRGIDGELNLNEAFAKLSEKKTLLIIGGSFVSKYQDAENPLYYLPENVAAWAARFNLTRGKIAVNGEYAYKYQDPSSDNNYIYKDGEAMLLNASYSQKGLGILLAAKRIDNMSYRSDRNAKLNDLSMNFLPPTCKTHTYSSLAMYPYATQSNGELGYQAEVLYKFKKETFLGGKYGTNVSANFSMVNDIKRVKIDTSYKDFFTPGTDGYKVDYFNVGSLFYEDLNVEINKKISDKLSGLLIYQYLIYNNDVVKGAGSWHGKIYTHVAIADITYKIRPEKAIRFEVQHLSTKQDKKNWAMALVEFSMPGWFITVYDQYNYGNSDKDKRVHYFNAGIGYTRNANRIQISYGKQREGIMCVGGVCRSVPASNGLFVSVSSTF